MKSTEEEELDVTKHEKRETVENEFFSDWTITLRNIGGIFAALTTCAIAILNAITTHVSVRDGGGWPNDLTMLIVNTAPAIIAWNFMRANKLIELIMGGVEPKGKKVRNVIAKIISADEPSDNKSNKDT